MYKPLELYVGLRYTRAKRRNHFISFISFASMAGIFLGVTVLITVISVMNGFESELRTRILGMIAHATVLGSEESLEGWEEVVKVADRDPHVLGSAPFVERQTLLQGRRIRGAIVRGISPELESKVSKLPQKMVSGSVEALKPGEFGLILGIELSWSLGVGVGDKVTVFAPQVRTTPAGLLPQVRRFTVVGLFEVGMNEYDGHLAIVHMSDAARLFRMGDKVSGVRLKLDDMYGAWRIGRELVERLPGNYRVTDWTRQHANWFRAVKTEKMTMFIIMALIVTVAAFNIVSTLIMAVTDKQADIAILRTLGASPGQVMRAFMVQGTLIGAVGTLLGVVGGVLLAINVENIVPFLEQAFGIDFMASDVYYITDLRGEVRADAVTKIALFSFLASFFSTLYPSWRAAKTQPAEALRYE